MAKITSGKRYAQAAFELALERKDVESWREGLRKIAELTAEGDLMALLESPRLSFDAKRKLLEKRLGKIEPLVLNLALLLVSKGTLGLGPNILRQYDQLFDDHRKIERAKVITAWPLEDKDRKAISRRLGEMVERKVLIDGQVDSQILGGFIARIGDTLIDGSVRQRLEMLRKDLIEGRR